MTNTENTISFEHKELNIHVSASAANHFKKLIDDENDTGLALKILVAHEDQDDESSGVGIVFLPKHDQTNRDYSIQLDGFKFFIDFDSAAKLKDATIDFANDEVGGGHLQISAPNLKSKAPEDGTLFDKVAWLLENEINPSLKAHKGNVELIEVDDNNSVHLKFSGGCQGCSMAGMTLKNGIEKSLREKFPEINEVIDVTKHSEGKNPFLR